MRIEEKIKQIKKEVDEVQEQDIEIQSEEQKEKVEDLLIKIKKKIKEIEKAREEYAKPFYRQYKKLSNKFKEQKKPLEKKEDRIKNALLNYKESKIKAIDEKETKTGEVIPKPAGLVKKDEGTISEMERVDFKILDKKKIPLEYLKVDKTKIRKDIKKGKEISGIKKVIKKSVVVRTK